jgi:membrane associated rhomboid family serine protease
MYLELLLSVLVAAGATIALSSCLRWHAPARKNGRWKSLFGFFLPALLLVWASVGWMMPTGLTSWGAIWFPVGALAMLVGVLLATVAAPRVPTRREERRVRRRGEALDPVFLLYTFMIGVLVLAAAVTRYTWA